MGKAVGGGQEIADEHVGTRSKAFKGDIGCKREFVHDHLTSMPISSTIF